MCSRHTTTDKGYTGSLAQPSCHDYFFPSNIIATNHKTRWLVPTKQRKPRQVLWLFARLQQLAALLFSSVPASGRLLQVWLLIPTTPTPPHVLPVPENLPARQRRGPVFRSHTFWSCLWNRPLIFLPKMDTALIVLFLPPPGS